MTEPPRPPGDGSDATDPAPTPPPATGYSMPGEAPSPAFPPPPATPDHGTPGAPPPAPTSGGPAPTSGGPAPTSGGAHPTSGGYPPPQGGFPPGGAYPPGYPPSGGYGAPPPGYANNDEKTWVLIAHFGGLVAGFVAPLVAMLAKGNESPTVRAHSIEALNFQITWTAATLIAVILAACSFGLLFFLPLITWLVIIVFSILGGVKANDGILYHYPMTVRLVK